MLLIQSLGLGVPGNVGESVCLQKGFVFGAVQHLTHETEGAGGDAQRFLKHRFKDLARIMFAEGLLLSAGDSGKQANGGIISFIAVRRSPDGNEGNDPAVRLLAAITSAQKKALGKHDAGEIFEAMLEETLGITASAFGFMGEVLHSPEDKPFLKTHALTNISWNTETQALYEQHLAQELEFTNLDTLFGAALRTGDPVISNKPAHDPRRGGLPTGHPPIESFLGLPVYEEDRMIGLIGLANRPGGYDQEIIAFLAPLLTTCATLITFFRNDEARIAEEVGEDSKAGGDLQHVITAADRAVDLVDQILAVSRQSEREREPIAIQHIIKETLELLRPSISSRSGSGRSCPNRCQ